MSFDKNKEKMQLIVTNQSDYNGVMIPTRMLYVSPNINSNEKNASRETSGSPRGPTSTNHSRGGSHSGHRQ